MMNSRFTGSIVASGAILVLSTTPVWGGDVEVQLSAGDGFVVKDNTGAVERLRVHEDTGNISRNGALFVHTTGSNNTFVGVNVGTYITTGVQKVLSFEPSNGAQGSISPLSIMSEIAAS